MLLNPLRTSLSMPRMPRTSIAPSIVADTRRSWICRFCATAAMPAVRQPPRATSTYSTGVAPLSSDAKISGWSMSKVYCVRCFCSSPRPKNPSTVELLCVPFFHSVVERHMKLAAAGASVSATRAPSSASTLTPLSTGVSSIVIVRLPCWDGSARWTPRGLRRRPRPRHRGRNVPLDRPPVNSVCGSFVGDRPPDGDHLARFGIERRTELRVGLYSEPIQHLGEEGPSRRGEHDVGDVGVA